MRKLLALALIVATFSGCQSVEQFVASRRAIDDIVATDGTITQQMLDDAWKDALKYGKGNPSWAVPVALARVVYVPSTLAIGPYQFYGITVTEPMFVKGKLELVETIEIHLPHNLACHIKQVLTHELIHTVFTRRYLTDKTFMGEVEAAGDSETLVRQVYPIDDMGLCGD